MKVAKILAAVGLMFSSIAYAGTYMEVQYYEEENRNTKEDSNKVGIVVGGKTADKMDYSLKYETSNLQNSFNDFGGLELRARKSFDTNFHDFKPYIGARVGGKFARSEDIGYYAIDVGVKFPLISNWLSGDVGYRYRDSFKSSDNFDSNRYHVAVSYAVTKEDSISLRYSQSNGSVNEEKNSWRVAYTHSFK